MLGVVWATFGLLSVCALDRMQDFRLLLLVQVMSLAAVYVPHGYKLCTCHLTMLVEPYLCDSIRLTTYILLCSISAFASGSSWASAQMLSTIYPSHFLWGASLVRQADCKGRHEEQ